MKLNEVRAMERPAPDPPLHRQALVGLLVGCLLGPITGWLAGTLATFLAVYVVNHFSRGVNNMGIRLTALTGGLIGILLGLIVGPLVGVPLRLASSSILKSLKDGRAAAVVGAALGLACGLAIDQYWHPSPEAFVYTLAHSAAVGGAVGAVAVRAQPEWL